MKTVRELPAETVHQILEHIQRILWADRPSMIWDPNKEWASDTIEDVAAVLDYYGLRPGAIERLAEQPASDFEMVRCTDCNGTGVGVADSESKNPQCRKCKGSGQQKRKLR